MHHIHISTGFAFAISLLIVGVIGGILWFIRTVRKDRLAAERRLEEIRLDRDLFKSSAARVNHSVGAKTEADYAAPAFREYYSGTPRQTYMPRPDHAPSVTVPATTVVAPGSIHYVAPAPYYGMDPGLAMVEGMLIGEALSSGHHDHTTIINEGPTYVDSSPSYTSSSDSGFSYSDSGSSYDSGSSGGFDASW